MTPLLFLLAVLVWLAAASPALAHQYWLFPSRYAPAAGEAVDVAAVAGTGFRGERIPWSPRRCVRLLARGARTIDLAAAPRVGDLAWLRYSPADGGGAMLAYESNWASIELAPELFDAYLADEGLEGPLATRRALNPRPAGRERYRRCPKLWLTGTDAARASTPAGLPLEIVPMRAPGTTPATRVRVLWKGAPLAGALVQCWHAPLGAGGATADPEARDSVDVAWKSRTDARGVVTIPTATAGEWMLSVVHMEPCPERDAADWESTWSSLTFVRSGALQGRK